MPIPCGYTYEASRKALAGASRNAGAGEGASNQTSTEDEKSLYAAFVLHERTQSAQSTKEVVKSSCVNHIGACAMKVKAEPNPGCPAIECLDAASAMLCLAIPVIAPDRTCIAWKLDSFDAS